MEKNKRKSERKEGRPTVDEYLKMDETAKDMAIHNAVIRLQRRIQEILYLMNTEGKSGIAGAGEGAAAQREHLPPTEGESSK